MKQQRQEIRNVAGKASSSTARISGASLAAAFAAFFLSALMINHGLVDSSLPAGPGLTMDESFNIDQGVYLYSAFEQHGPLLLMPSVSQEVFGSKRYLADHPPLGRLLLGTTHQLFSWLIPGSEGCAYNVPAARLGSCAAFAITVLLLSEYARRSYGSATSVCTAIMLIGLPHVTGHARLAALESSTNLAWVAALLPLLTWWTKTKPPTNGQAILSGLMWGLLLLTKVQGVFLPVIVFLWSVWQFRWRALRPLILFGLTGSLIFFLGWPWLWLDPINHIRQYLGRTTTRTTLYCWYFGQRYADKLVPWHFPFVTFLISLPAWTIVGLILRSVGGAFDRAERLLVVSIVFPLFMFAVPGVPVYDGTRLFLIVMPPVALVAARGFVLWLERPLQSAAGTVHSGSASVPGPGLERSGRTARGRVLRSIFWTVLAVIPLYWIMQPLAISQYGLLAGGNRGAAAMGMEAGYWGEALNSDFWRQVPEQTTLLVAPVSHQFQLSDMETLVPIVQARGIRLQPFRYDPSAQEGNLLLIHRLADLRPELAVVPPDANVLAESIRDGVVYSRVIDVLPESKPQEN